MDSEQITPDQVAAWKALCKMAEEFCAQHGTWGGMQPNDIIFRAFPSLIEAYEQVVEELGMATAERTRSVLLLRTVEWDRDRLTARVVEVEAEVRTLRNLSVTLAEERDALRAALDDSTGLFLSLTGDEVNEEGAIDAQIKDNRDALGLAP